MSRDKVYTLFLVAAAIFAGVTSFRSSVTVPSVWEFAFWTVLLIATELLPVGLAFGTEVTMSFPVQLAVAILFPPWAAMLMAGLGVMDLREVRREIPLHQAFFNRTQQALSVGMASAAISPFRADIVAERLPPALIWAVTLAAFLYTVSNLGFVALWIHFRQGQPFLRALSDLPPRPMLGFWMSYVLLAGVGAATAVVYEQIDYGAWAVAAFIIPLLFARLSIIGAREQQKLTERLQKQQQALLEATEAILKERETERHRIAEHIHDSSLQLLAAASYGCGNANDLIAVGRVDDATNTVANTRAAIDEAIKVLRSSLVDLRKAAIEEGGLMASIRKYGDQVMTLWGIQFHVEGDLDREPPVSVALGAFQILQEGVNNALKHAHSDVITVRINEDDGMVRVVVEDQGAGFDLGAEIGAEHVGMKLMKDRAEQLGGRIELASVPGEGTRIEAILPGGVRQ